MEIYYHLSIEKYKKHTAKSISNSINGKLTLAQMNYP